MSDKLFLMVVSAAGWLAVFGFWYGMGILSVPRAIMVATLSLIITLLLYAIVASAKRTPAKGRPSGH